MPIWRYWVAYWATGFLSFIMHLHTYPISHIIKKLQIMASTFVFSRPYYNGRAIGTVLRLYVIVCRLTWSIVAKRCVLEQNLLLRAYWKSYMRNRLVPKWMTLTFV